MGIQSFKFPIDFLNNIETPVIFIAKKDKTIVNSVSVYDGLKLTFNLHAFQTAEFKIYKDVDGVKQDYFNDFADILEKEIERERAKLTPEERKNADNFEKKLRTILGLY